MPLLTAVLMAAGVVGQAPAPSKLAEAAVAHLSSRPPDPGPPQVTYDIREVTTTSLDWRSKLLPKLHPVARQDGAAVWSLDKSGVQDLLAACQGHPQDKVFQAPRMVARVGDPVRMTNEETSHYIAHLNRISDGPPNQGTNVAFQPEVDQIHHGIRVELSRTEAKGPALFAHVVVQQTRLHGFHVASYRESVVSTGRDPEVVKTSLLSKLRPEDEGQAITGTLQVPEVTTRRIEGDWLVPSDGALLVGLGPESHAPKLGGRKTLEERLILLTAQIGTPPPVDAPAPAAAPTP